MDPLVWSVLCSILMVGMIVLELFTPSFGFLTILAVVFLAGSIALGFNSSPVAGYVMTGVNLALFPLSVAIGMQVMRRSPLALRHEIQAGIPPHAAPPKAVHELVGKEGVAVTVLRPSGTAQIGETRFDVVTEGKFVESGKPLKVLRVEGSRVVVEAIG
ncbi:MAG: hypothetical protein KIS92_15930 [Planctomycetota bacterium]|nr:hypothetical protein [Planctomycetota bacterium]